MDKTYSEISAMKPKKQKAFDKASFQESVKKHLSATYATTIETASERQWYLAMGRALAELTTFDLLATEADERIKKSEKR
jgi:starch phosphorylase